MVIVEKLEFEYKKKKRNKLSKLYKSIRAIVNVTTRIILCI